jgi:hypothetical protein
LTPKRITDWYKSAEQKLPIRTSASEIENFFNCISESINEPEFSSELRKGKFMFKKTVATLTVLMACASANAICTQGEAQIIGHVEKTDVFANGCRVFLTGNSRVQQHGLCPIDEVLLSSQGIDVGLHKEDVCSMQVGEPISGILIDKGGYLILE